jgi:hypothetical protein
MDDFMHSLANIRFEEILAQYCSSSQKAIIYFESKKDSKEKLLEFYTGKMYKDFLVALKNDDDCFFEFENHHIAIQWAEQNFPIKSLIVGEYEDEDLFIEVNVYDAEGYHRWTNNY